MSIELRKPRTIVIEDRGQRYTLTVGVIQKQTWLRYFEGILSTSENQNGKRVDSFDSSAARLQLVESCLTDAQGYQTADGSPVTAATDWQKLLPLRHRLAVANALISVEPSANTDEQPLTLGVESVFLDAIWSADDDGVMRKYHNLCHRFRTPSAEHQRRFSRDASRSRVIGGSRTGKTQWLGAQATLAELYDELVLSVDGYTVDGAELCDKRDEIVQYMDTYHKVAAADLLFSPAQPNISEER
jgi:hypothetical protein